METNLDALWSPAAIQDLIDIWAYFVNLASPETADTLVGEISGAAELIAENPQAWRERPDLLPGIRGLPVHPYTIFYRIADGKPEIVRVLHERRDIAAVLSAPADELPH